MVFEVNVPVHMLGWEPHGLERGLVAISKRLASRRMMSVSTTFSQGVATADTRERTCYLKLAFLSLDRAIVRVF